MYVHVHICAWQADTAVRPLHSVLGCLCMLACLQQGVRCDWFASYISHALSFAQLALHARITLYTWASNLVWLFCSMIAHRRLCLKPFKWRLLKPNATRKCACGMLALAWTAGHVQHELSQVTTAFATVADRASLKRLWAAAAAAT